jgi:hypothetical protein
MEAGYVEWVTEESDPGWSSDRVCISKRGNRALSALDCERRVTISGSSARTRERF